jgi:hypothetical protein
MYTLSFVDVMIIGLAINQIIEVWRHSTLFQRVRYWLQVWQYEVAVWKPHPSNKIATFIPDLLLCNWCFSIWVAVGVIALSASGNWWAWLVILALGGSRIANLINDVLYSYCRTPKYDAGKTLTYPTEVEYKEELRRMNAETERHEMNVQEDIKHWGQPETKRPKRETNDLTTETPYPPPETKTGLFDTSVSAYPNEKTQTTPPPPPSERR